ncbi:MAG: IS200/IS605 family element transposase accessory protein TnpB [Chloroflexi bacterium]|nr:IS200/IS605 family element transposase accessory protein TnpB [Chloroflexota bacterium]
MIVRKAFKYRIYPNREQQQRLAVQFGHARYVYNWGLAYSEGKYPGYNRLAKQLTTLKASEETSWLREAHSQVLQQSLKNLDRAFENFFSKRAGYPKFKSKRARQSIRYPQPQERWLAPNGRHIYLPKVGHVRLVMHRPLAGAMKNITVSRTKSGSYFVSLQVEMELAEPVYCGNAIGLDLGLSEFAVLSTGEKIAPPQYYRRAQKKRRRLARQLSRKKPRSRNREKARLRLARLDEHIANQRRDFHHKLSRQLVEENGFIGLEDLNVRGMMTNHHLAKSIGDVGWSAFTAMLAYKGGWYGCHIEQVSRWYPSSKTCSTCGAVMEAIPLQVRQWQCPECGVIHDRDVNAAINILHQSTAGAAERNAWGQYVRPDPVGQRWLNQEANPL